MPALRRSLPVLSRSSCSSAYCRRYDHQPHLPRRGCRRGELRIDAQCTGRSLGGIAFRGRQIVFRGHVGRAGTAGTGAVVVAIRVPLCVRARSQ